MAHFKKYWYWYALGALALGLVIYFWDNIMAWVSPGASRTQSPGSTAKQACIRVSDGCSYNGLYVPCGECTKRGIAIN